MGAFFALQNPWHPLSSWSAQVTGCIQLAPIITAFPPNYVHRLI